jgi:hypothetical protein
VQAVAVIARALRRNRGGVHTEKTFRAAAFAVVCALTGVTAATLAGNPARAATTTVEQEYPPVTYGFAYPGGWQTPPVPSAPGAKVNIPDAAALQRVLGTSSVPGTTYVLADGNYTGTFKASSGFGGTPTAPVVITLKRSLSAVFTGATRLDLSATANVVLTNTEWQLVSLPNAIVISAPNLPVGSGRGHRITGNVFDRVGDGADGSVSGIIKADHPAKGRVGGWEPALIAAGLPATSGVTTNDIYTQGYGIPVEDLNLTVDNNIFDSPANPTLWLSNGLRGVDYARNQHIGTPTIVGFEKELVKIGFGWPQGHSCNIKIMNNTFEGGAALSDADVSPYVIGIKELGTEVAFNQFNVARARVSARSAPMNFHNNAMTDGRIFLGGSGNIVNDNYLVSQNPPFSEALVTLSADGSLADSIYDGTAPYRPFFSLRADGAQIARNTFISKAPATFHDVNVSVGYLGAFVAPPTGVVWNDNAFVRLNNASNFVYPDGVLTGAWSRNVFHTHSDTEGALTSVPIGALANGGSIRIDVVLPTTSSTTSTTKVGGKPVKTTTTRLGTAPLAADTVAG